MSDLEAAAQGRLEVYDTREAAAYLRYKSPGAVRRLVAAGLLQPDIKGNSKQSRGHKFRKDTLVKFGTK